MKRDICFKIFVDIFRGCKHVVGDFIRWYLCCTVRSFLATFPEDTLPVRSAFCSSPWTAFSLGTHHLHS